MRPNEEPLLNPRSTNRHRGWDIELAKLLARAYMSYWYGGLYVVIEGYRRLKLQDPSIDKLLLSRNTMLLKKFRDGVLRHDEEGHRRRN